MKPTILLLAAIVCAIAISCDDSNLNSEGTDNDTSINSDTQQPNSPVSNKLTPVTDESQQEDPDPASSLTAAPASYLEATVEPCTRLPNADVDPCERRRWTFTSIDNEYSHPDQMETLVIERETSLIYPPMTTRESVRYAFESESGSANPSHRRAPHVVVRGVYVPETTRCMFHEKQVLLEWEGGIKFTDPIKSPGYAQEIACYVDFQANEYLVGRGPVRLTVRPWFWVPIAGNKDNDLFKSEDYEKHLASHVSPRWEGREFVLWLGINKNLSVEVWSVNGLMDVQRREDGEIVVVSPVLSEFRPDSYDIKPYMHRLEPTLEEYARDVASEHAAVSSELGFEMVEDANLKHLREHLSKIGIYDQEEVEISLPPSIPE